MEKEQFKILIAGFDGFLETLTGQQVTELLQIIDKQVTKRKLKVVKLSNPVYDIENVPGYEAFADDNYKQGFRDAATHVIPLLNKWFQATSLMTALTKVAQCDPGDDTSAVISETAAEMMKQLSKYHDMYNKHVSQKHTRRQEITFLLNQSAPAEDMRLMKRFTTDYFKIKGKRKAHDEFRKKVGTAFNAQKGFWGVSVGDVELGGRGKDEIKKEIGRLAAHYPQVSRGKTYTIGLDVLHDLTNIEPHLRSQLQKDCIGKLEKLLSQGKRKLGNYVKEALDNHSLESSRKSNYPDSNRLE